MPLVSLLFAASAFLGAENAPASIATAPDDLGSRKVDEESVRKDPAVEEPEDPEKHLLRLAADIRGNDRYDQTSAGQLLVKMCLNGTSDACELVTENGGEGAIEALMTACDRGSGRACAVLVAQAEEDRIGRRERRIGYMMLPTSLGIAALALLEFILPSPIRFGDLPDLLAIASGLYFSVGAVAALLGGIGMIIYGFHKRSTARDLAHQIETPAVIPAPVVIRSGREAFPGLAVCFTF